MSLLLIAPCRSGNLIICCEGLCDRRVRQRIFDDSPSPDVSRMRSSRIAWEACIEAEKIVTAFLLLLKGARTYLDF